MFKRKIIIGLVVLLSLSTISIAEDTTGTTTETTTLALSDDIGKMADRIGDMADRINEMGDKIVETQKIQSENLLTTQKNILDAITLINTQLEQNNKIIESLITTDNKMIECMCPSAQ